MIQLIHTSCETSASTNAAHTLPAGCDPRSPVMTNWRPPQLPQETSVHEPATRQVTAAPPLYWSCSYPARADQVRKARQSLARLLDARPAAADAVLCLSELATNATIHSRSRRPGGRFTVRVCMRLDDSLRVEVQDEGGPWTLPEDADGRHGRGLLIVRKLVREFGCSGDSDSGRTIWFEMDWPDFPQRPR
jgi:serine/threonine-protein kinase RsbW